MNEKIEAAAKAINAASDDAMEWTELMPYWQGAYMRMAKAALEAALPPLRAREEIAREIESYLFAYTINGDKISGYTKPISEEIADAILSRTAGQEWRDTLKPFADAAEMYAWPCYTADNYRISAGNRLTVGDLRRARDLLDLPAPPVAEPKETP